MDILKNFNNELLKRKEVKVLISSNSNPGYSEAKRLLCSEFKCEEEVIVIKQMAGRFGTTNFIVKANIYHSKEDKENTEAKPKNKSKEEKTNAEENAKKS